MEPGESGFRGEVGYPGRAIPFAPPPPTAHPSDEKLISLLFHGYRISVSDDEKVLEIDCGDGCTTL